ncbi:BTB domain containing protein [Asbolus verrucosus]|uniref:BTB domain containing protein n=1 Tax=Asbolus verrucosus TaxID=1661398 RepID=A0A482VH86_ASBVE|nr:BTB domain containing protein [Asbolus verrucosus]
MYSLYRAWLSLGPCPIPALPPAPLNLTSPAHVAGAPDVALQVGPGMTQFSAHRAVLSAHSGFFKAALLNHTDSTPIAVPNVNVDEFSSLLTFMYTGYLDLNLTNIYNILLATHILHMPRALEICRSFLLQSQPSLEARPSIIKPIASRKAALPTQQIYAPTFSSLQKSEDTPFKTVAHGGDVSNRASTSKIEEEPKAAEKPATVPEKNKEKSKHKKRGGGGGGGDDARSGVSGSDKVIIDIACCDGPVRFHRVINKNYGQQQQQSENAYEVQEVNRNAALNKVMTENIRDQQMSDENQSNEMFTCLYCNHTFKSQYCYQKHARRHLNPVSLDAKSAATAPKESKREVKLLDMNVQYYPCKTCGSKFPSYYFVHKHRKMCHADEMADNNNKNNEMLPENNSDSGSAIDVEAVNM